MPRKSGQLGGLAGSVVEYVILNYYSVFYSVSTSRVRSCTLRQSNTTYALIGTSSNTLKAL
jgi:hypothetical protein